MSKNPKKVSP